MDEFIGILIIAGIIGYIYFKIKQENENEKFFSEAVERNALQKSRKIINKNKIDLARQRQKSIYTDNYGKENLNNWYNKEISYFIENHIYPILNQDELANRHLFLDHLFAEIDEKAKKQKLPKITFDKTMSGFEFEHFCEQLFLKTNWQVKKTKSGADQGIDLIIEKNHKKLGVQCKKYSRPVGNKAVQEVKAGISYYNLDGGMVLTNNKFTKSAIELANTNGIQLVHYLDIDKLAST